MATKKGKAVVKTSKVKKAKGATKVTKLKRAKATKAVKAKKVAKASKKKTAVKKTKTASKKVVPLNSNELVTKAASKIGIPATKALELTNAMMADAAALLKKGYSTTMFGVKIKPHKKAATKARKMHSPLLGKDYKIAAKPKRTVYNAKVLKRLENLIK